MASDNGARIVPPTVPMTITGPLIKFVLESGSGHAIDLEPTYVYP